MKSYIKSSFLALLFVAVFSMGFSSANAKTPTKDKTVTKTQKVKSSIKTVKTVPLRCQMQSIVNVAVLLNANNQARYQSLEQLFTAYSPCKARLIFLNNGTIIEVDGNCDITIYP